jgi:maleylpyruvate isomerase
MKLHNYFRSGTSHRLRIALNLKRVSYEYLIVNLLKDEHLKDEFKRINPQGFVPALQVGEDVLIQSPAIIEWLEEKFPNPPLLPTDPIDRQHVRALACANWLRYPPDKQSKNFADSSSGIPCIRKSNQ